MTIIAELDLRIIRLLLADGIADECAAAIAAQAARPLELLAVRRRRNRLEQEGYIRLVGSVNPVKLGFNSVAIIGVQAVANRIAAVELALQKLPEVHLLGLCTGGYDLMLEAWLRSNDDLVRFTTESLARIEGIVRTDVFQFLKLSKFYGWSGTLPAIDQPGLI